MFLTSLKWGSIVGVFLGLVGLVGFFVFLIMLLVAAIRKRPKKVSAIGLAACFVAFALGIGLSSGDSTPASTAEPESQASSKAEGQDAEASGTEPESSSTASEPKDQEMASAVDGDIDSVAEGEGDIGKYHVAIKGIEVSKDYQDNPAVIVTYEFTNNSDEPKSFWPALEDKVFQAGIECSTPIMKIDGIGSDGKMTEIKPGITYEFQVGYTLNDGTTEIEVEIRETFTFSKNPTVISKTFPLDT